MAALPVFSCPMSAADPAGGGASFYLNCTQASLAPGEARADAAI
jgi:S-formylglutathione hydrolase FrmB